jgi:superfamily II DNA or RNA helicase
VTSVGQLIRGVDIPALDNVFSLLNTSNAKKYLQIFGRGARGEQVNFYDYGGSRENMVRLADIYNEYQAARQRTIDEDDRDRSRDTD